MRLTTVAVGMGLKFQGSCSTAGVEQRSQIAGGRDSA